MNQTATSTPNGRATKIRALLFCSLLLLGGGFTLGHASTRRRRQDARSHLHRNLIAKRITQSLLSQRDGHDTPSAQPFVRSHRPAIIAGARGVWGGAYALILLKAAREPLASLVTNTRFLRSTHRYRYPALHLLDHPLRAPPLAA